MKSVRAMVAIPVLPFLAACGQAPEAPSVAPSELETRRELSCRQWRLLEGGTAASFRGLSAVGEDIAWVSGTGGTWGRTVDRGESWRMEVVPEAEELDFRDVDAFGAETAYLMSAGPAELSQVYKTTDGGATWELVLTNPDEAGFFDGMAFWTPERGVLYGDPVDGRFSVFTTADGGATWMRVGAEDMPQAFPGEAGFAASGSGIAVAPGGLAWFGTGGPVARVFRSADYGRSWTAAETPLRSGAGSAGVFSLAFVDPLHGVAVGGDYSLPAETAANAARTADGGETWTPVAAPPPAGYRSAVAYVPGTAGRKLIAVGTTGTDLSLDGGETWTLLDTGGYNSVAFGSESCAGWAAGPEGKIARLE